MYNDDTEILFPTRVIPALRGMHGSSWDELVDRIVGQSEGGIEHVAFVLMMVKLGGCASCNADSFRAMKGCTQCAKQTIKRFRGNEVELLHAFNEAKNETEVYFYSVK